MRRFTAKKQDTSKRRGRIWGVWDIHKARWMNDEPALKDEAMRRADYYNRQLGYISERTA